MSSRKDFFRCSDALSYEIWDMPVRKMLSTMNVSSGGLLENFQCCIAGGAFADISKRSFSVDEKIFPGEVDVFLFDGTDFDEVSSYLEVRGYSQAHVSEHAVLFEKYANIPKIHVVKSRPFGLGGGWKYASDVLSGFDISGCMAAADKEGIVVSEVFSRSMSEGVLSVKASRFNSKDECLQWFSTFARCAKYLSLSKGFELLDNSFVDFLTFVSEKTFPESVGAMNILRDALDDANSESLKGFTSNAVYGRVFSVPKSIFTPDEKYSGMPWRERVSVDDEFADSVKKTEELVSKKIMFSDILRIPAEAFVKSGLRFPLSLLEIKTRSSYIFDRVLNDFAFAVYIVSGPDANFSGTYVPPRHEMNAGVRTPEWYIESSLPRALLDIDKFGGAVLSLALENGTTAADAAFYMKDEEVFERLVLSGFKVSPETEMEMRVLSNSARVAAEQGKTNKRDECILRMGDILRGKTLSPAEVEEGGVYFG